MILVLNCGSSSVKYKVFLVDGDSFLPAAWGIVERIGTSDARIRHTGAQGEVNRAVSAGDHSEALEVVAELVGGDDSKGAHEIVCVAHRVVHGGRISRSAVHIDDDVIHEIKACVNLAPLHNPANLAGIGAARSLFGNAYQVAVLDTAFHQSMPEVAYLYALPYEFYEKHGIRRFGFHGISHLYVSRRAADLMAGGRTARRLVTCHLGAGSSVTAVLDGRSVDTSMGFTPLEGLIMATRCGDMDPAVVLFMAEKLGLTFREIDSVLNRSSGLLGVSGSSADVRDLISAASEGHRRSALALEMFCYRVRKYVGAYAAAMGGLDGLVFTAGIGENSPEVRSSVCSPLGFLGVRLDEEKNSSAVGGVEGVISEADAPVSVFVIPTDEEMVMAREAWRMLALDSGMTPGAFEDPCSE